MKWNARSLFVTCALVIFYGAQANDADAMGVVRLQCEASHRKPADRRRNLSIHAEYCFLASPFFDFHSVGFKSQDNRCLIRRFLINELLKPTTILKCDSTVIDAAV